MNILQHVRRNNMAIQWTVAAVFGLLMAALMTNPSSDHFNRHKNFLLPKEDGVGKVIMGISSVKSYGVFSIAHAGTGRSYLGIFGTWIPIFTNLTWPNCSYVSNCNGRGICIGANTCLCLPSSKSDERCSFKIAGFEPFILFRSLPLGLGDISILEVIMLVSILLSLACFFRKSLYKVFGVQWATTVFQFKIWQLLTAPFVHVNPIYALYCLQGFYAYAPSVYSLIQERSFVKLFYLSELFGIIIGLLGQYFSGLSSGVVCGLSPFLCCIQTFIVLASSHENASFSVFHDLVQMIFAHLVVEFMLTSSKFNPYGSLSGVFSGYVFYRFMTS